MSRLFYHMQLPLVGSMDFRTLRSLRTYLNFRLSVDPAFYSDLFDGLDVLVFKNGRLQSYFYKCAYEPVSGRIRLWRFTRYYL